VLVAVVAVVGAEQTSLRVSQLKSSKTAWRELLMQPRYGQMSVSSVWTDYSVDTYSTVADIFPSRYMTDGQACIGNEEHSEKKDFEARHFVCDWDGSAQRIGCD
jgi:hypothetical protein